VRAWFIQYGNWNEYRNIQYSSTYAEAEYPVRQLSASAWPFGWKFSYCNCTTSFLWLYNVTQRNEHFLNYFHFKFFYIFYMSRTREFTFGKTVVYTVMVRYVLHAEITIKGLYYKYVAQNSCP
jgi:hypothetical protein